VFEMAAGMGRTPEEINPLLKDRDVTYLERMKKTGR